MENNVTEELKIKVLDQYVLVRQVMKKKKTFIIRDASKDDRDKFDYSYMIVDKGSKCEREIQVGEYPIFDEYVKFSGLKVIKRDEELGIMVALLIIHENHIIAIDREPLIINEETGETNESKTQEN